MSTVLEVNEPLRREGGRLYIMAPAMERLVRRIFEGAGCGDEEAASLAARLCGANLRGHDSHGVIRTPRYVDWLAEERIYPNREIVVEQDSDVLAIVDGVFGLGQTVGQQAVDLGIAKAKARGISVIGLKNAGHLGRVGDWAERAALEGVASIHMVNVRGSLLVAPFGGIDRRGSTSPFCCGVPGPDGVPLVLDFATSLVAEGKALVAFRGGAALPEGALISGDGTLTSDPTPLYGEPEEGRYPDPSRGPGALCGFGLHKGSGLNFFMEMFAGALTGSGTAAVAGETDRRRFCNGMLSVYMALDHFHSDDWFAREVRGYIDFFKASRPATPGGEVLIPGEKELRTKVARERSGLPVAEETWSDILGAARQVGLTDADIDALLAGA